MEDSTDNGCVIEGEELDDDGLIPANLLAASNFLNVQLSWQMVSVNVQLLMEFWGTRYTPLEMLCLPTMNTNSFLISNISW